MLKPGDARYSAIREIKPAYTTWFQNKADPSLHSRYAEARKTVALHSEKAQNPVLGEFDVNLIPITAKPAICSDKPFGDSAAKNLILLDPSSTKIASFSEMRTALAYGEIITNTVLQRSFNQVVESQGVGVFWVESDS